MINDAPKIFVSYCRQPEENLIRTQQLAERLTRDGVYVVIDLWDLKDGQDKNAYMEQMVIDPTVDKVLLICNRQYVEKADNRKGGVGIESTIISTELYEKIEQTKFIPVIFETDDQGNAYIPVFAKSRIYIDLSSDEKYEEGYDQLLRDIYGKPKFDRPPLGTMPAYLKTDAPAYLKTAGMVNAIRTSIERDSKRTPAIIANYIETFLAAILDYKIKVESSYNAQKIVEVVETSIDSMQILKNDFIGFLGIIVRSEYCTSDLFQDFFERLLQTYEDNDIELPAGNSIQSYLTDNFRFFNYELFLSFVAIMINNCRFDVVSEVVRTPFCVVSKRWSRSAEEQTFCRFRSYIRTLDELKHNMTGSRRVSIAADTVKQYTTILKFQDIVSADILLYYMSLVFPGNGYWEQYWYPELSIYNSSAELYPRIVSKRYFEKFKRLFNVEDKDSFIKLILSVQEPNIRDAYHRIPPIKQGLCVDEVATMH